MLQNNVVAPTVQQLTINSDPAYGQDSRTIEAVRIDYELRIFIDGQPAGLAHLVDSEIMAMNWPEDYPEWTKGWETVPGASLLPPWPTRWSRFRGWVSSQFEAIQETHRQIGGWVGLGQGVANAALWVAAMSIPAMILAAFGKLGLEKLGW